MSRKNERVSVVIPPPDKPSPFPPATQSRLDRAAQRLFEAQQRFQMAQQTLQGAQNEVLQQDGRLKGILETALEEIGLPLDTEARIENGHVVIPSWTPNGAAPRTPAQIVAKATRRQIKKEFAK